MDLKDFYKDNKTDLTKFYKDNEKNIDRGAVGLAGSVATGRGITKAFPTITKRTAPVVKDLDALRKFTVNLPINIAKGDPLKTFGKGNTRHLSLAPDLIWNKSKDIAKKKHKNFDSLNKEDQFEAINKNKLRSTLSLLKEQEEKARKEGYDRMMGISHFDPQTAAKLGYQDTDFVNPKVQKAALTSKHSPFNYYRGQKNKSIKNNETGPMSIYWKTAPAENLRVMEKDLRIPAKEAVRSAKDKIDPEKAKKARKVERAFNKEYTEKLKRWFMNGEN